MQASDYRGMPAQELKQLVLKLREEMFNLRFKAVAETVTDPAGLRGRRKQIAHIQTVLSEKARGEKQAQPATGGQAAGAPAAAAAPCCGKGLSREQRQKQRLTAKRLAQRAAKKAARKASGVRRGSGKTKKPAAPGSSPKKKGKE